MGSAKGKLTGLLALMMLAYAVFGSAVVSANGGPVTATTDPELKAAIEDTSVSEINLVQGQEYTYEGDASGGYTVDRALTINGNGATLKTKNGMTANVPGRPTAFLNNARVYLSVAATGDLTLNNLVLQYDDTPPGDQTPNPAISSMIVLRVESGGNLTLDDVTFDQYKSNSDYLTQSGVNESRIGSAVYADPGAGNIEIKNSLFKETSSFREAITIREGTVSIHDNGFEGTVIPGTLRSSDGYEYGIYLYGGTVEVYNNTFAGYDSTTQVGYGSAALTWLPYFNLALKVYGNTFTDNVSAIDFLRKWTGFADPVAMSINEVPYDHTDMDFDDYVEIDNYFTSNNTIEDSNNSKLNIRFDGNNQVEIEPVSEKWTPIGGYMSPFIKATKNAENTQATLEFPNDPELDYPLIYKVAKLIELEEYVLGAWTHMATLTPELDSTLANKVVNLLPDTVHKYRVKMTHTIDDTIPFDVYTYSNPFEVDNLPPAAPVVNSPDTQYWSNNRLPTFSGTAEANSTIKIQVGGYTFTTTADGSGNWSYTSYASLPYGWYNLSVTATDAANNVSAAATIGFGIFSPNPSDSQPAQPSQPTQPTPPAGTNVRQVDVEVDGGGQADQAAKVDIVRTQDANGRQVDRVNLNKAKMDETVGKALQDGKNTVRVVVSDLPDNPADETNVALTKEAYSQLADNKLAMEIKSDYATVKIAGDSLAGWTNDDPDLYFRFVPIRKAGEREEVVERTIRAEVVRQAAGGREVQVLGTPMTIETNYQNRPVTLVFPLNRAALPTGAAERAEFLESLAVYIEHSDGEKALQRGTIVYDEAGNPIGIEIGIDKFSTFTIVSVEAEQHAAYVKGYPDGTFRPDRAITRAEMAAIIARLIPAEIAVDSSAKRYADVAAGFWAADAIARVRATGIMEGDGNGQFGPQRSITRAEFAAIAVRLSGADTAGEAAAFSDTAGHWAAADIAVAVGQGLLDGYEDGSFKPNQALTRAEAVTTLNRLFGRQPHDAVNTQVWSDVPSSHWAFEAILEASVDH